MESEDSSIIDDHEAFVSDELLQENTVHTAVTDAEYDTPPLQPELADQLRAMIAPNRIQEEQPV